MHWDQMSATPDDLRKRATRLRRGVGQLGIIESILDAADGPWLGVMDADGRGTAELRMHLAGRYRLTAVVTSAGKLSMVQMHAPTVGDRVISGKPALRQGWDETVTMPRQPDWLDYVIDWVGAASADVDRRTVITWQLEGADRRLAAMDDTLEGMRASLAEREQLRDELAAEIDHLRTEFASLPENPSATADPPADQALTTPDTTTPNVAADNTATEPDTVTPNDTTRPGTAVSDLPVDNAPTRSGTAVPEIPSATNTSGPGDCAPDHLPRPDTLPQENPNTRETPTSSESADIAPATTDASGLDVGTQI